MRPDSAAPRDLGHLRKFAQIAVIGQSNRLPKVSDLRDLVVDSIEVLDEL
jgi:hypothetical protein